MRDILISIVIPVYNVEKYLKKCIESILHQTYKMLEIILIDDGSTDNSPEICDNYAVSDSRVNVVHKMNEGVSVARNIGVNKATGEYLCFVDSDDFLPINAIENLLTKIEENHSDLCCGAWTKIGIKNTVTNYYETTTISVSNKEELSKYLWIEEVNGPVAKLYKMDIIRKNKLLFIPEIRIGEDAIFNYQYIRLCEKVSIISENVYYYNRLNIDSITHKFYKNFNICSLRCAIEQSKDILSEKIDEKNIIVQRIFCSRFLSCIDYALYYDLNDEILISYINDTINLFSPYIFIDSFSNNLEGCFLRTKYWMMNNTHLECRKKIQPYRKKSIWKKVVPGKVKQYIYRIIAQYKRWYIYNWSKIR